MIYKKGDLIEIGVADYEGDEDGFSHYAQVDVENISEGEIEALFDRNVLYTKICDDKHSEQMARENLISQLINEKK